MFPNDISQVVFFNMQFLFDGTQQSAWIVFELCGLSGRVVQIEVFKLHVMVNHCHVHWCELGGQVMIRRAVSQSG
jgi:hypothetical protein